MQENKFETADEIRLILSVMQTAQYSGNAEQMKQVLQLHDSVVAKLQYALAEIEKDNEQ